MMGDRKRLCPYGDRSAEKRKWLTQLGALLSTFYDSFFACRGGVGSAVHRMVFDVCLFSICCSIPTCFVASSTDLHINLSSCACDSCNMGTI